MNEEEDLNMPDMGNVEFQVAMEICVKMYRGLKEAGLSTWDASAIVASIMTRTDSYGAS